MDLFELNLLKYFFLSCVDVAADMARAEKTPTRATHMYSCARVSVHVCARVYACAHVCARVCM